MICQICNNEFKTNRSLSLHISRTHHMSIQEYYNTYLKSDKEGKCLFCNKDTPFMNINKGYRLFCSKTCCNKSEYHQTKMQETIISRYGGIGTASTIINEKIKTTNIQKYGAENLYASEYGKDKIKQTCLERYGTEYVLQSEEVKSKIVATSLIRYNTSNPANCISGRQKAARTRRKNDNDSSWEDYFERQCLYLNLEYKKRYNLDSRYPFMCDFYLPDIDTFIEINGYWTHNNHFFDKNDTNDIQMLNKWKEKANKGHKQYANAVHIWSCRDVEKHNYAIKNNLNYVVLWSYNDLINFFKDKENI